MWYNVWGLSRDPFAVGDPFEVSLPGHDETIRGLTHLIDAGQNWGVLCGVSGVGKSRMLRRVLTQARNPRRRMSISKASMGACELYRDLAAGLGVRLPSVASPADAWQGLERAVALCALQKQQVVLVLDPADAFCGGPEQEGLRRLGLLWETRGVKVTILMSQCEPPEDGFEGAGVADWSVVTRLSPLTLSEARHYLESKLASAGCREILFSPRALSRLHVHSGGVPRALDRLASVCLRAAALGGQEAVPSDLVESVGGETAGLLSAGLSPRGVVTVEGPWMSRTG